METSHASGINQNPARWIAAQHEAGHAVVGDIVGGSFQELVMLPAPAANGYAQLDWTSQTTSVRPTDAEAERPLVLCMLAGQIAELIAEGGTLAQLGAPSIVIRQLCRSQFETLMRQGQGLPGQKDDILKVAIVLVRRFSNDGVGREEYIKSTTFEAERLVRQNWSTIQVVASAAFDRGKVSRDEFFALIGDTSAINGEGA